MFYEGSKKYSKINSEKFNYLKFIATPLATPALKPAPKLYKIK
jgi:hypothetical protein